MTRPRNPNDVIYRLKHPDIYGSMADEAIEVIEWLIVQLMEAERVVHLYDKEHGL